MIGAKLRLGLRVVAYFLIAAAVLSAVGTITDHATGAATYPNPIALLVVVIASMATPMFQGGLLLAALSIDERLAQRN